MNCATTYPLKGQSRAKMSLHSSHKQADLPYGRTRVGNRVSLWLDSEVDGRSALARRFKEVFGEIATDLGGFDRMSTAQCQLARRCALLSVECERLEGQAVLGAAFDLDTYGQLYPPPGPRLSAPRHEAGAARYYAKLEPNRPRAQSRREAR